MGTETAVRCDFIFWDWKQQPDLQAVEASINSMLSSGATRIHLTTADTNDDSYCLVVSDSKLSQAEALHAYEDWEDTVSPDGPARGDTKPFVWNRR